MYTASGLKVSIAVNSTCDYKSNHNPTVVHVSSTTVTLICCVDEFPCDSTVQWYRDNTNKKVISNETRVTVDLTEAQETFVCDAKIRGTIDDPFCYEDLQGFITLILSIHEGEDNNIYSCTYISTNACVYRTQVSINYTV